MLALRQLLRRSVHPQRACHTGIATPVTSVADAVRTRDLQALDLSCSQDLLCRNLVCEKGFTDLRSLQVLDLSANEPLLAPPFSPADLPQLVELHTAA
ncbi:hypothetical protein WJX81_007508 [Elliptochloris bilobata]|uniref:Uncharacterized protein n=1 Tax=Elliptochloris bilobata TaxID=381761 RepID=A0AAW1RYH5_9CHLO